MFGSRGRKAMERNSASVLDGFKETIRNDVGENIDLDATVMLMGWMHYSIAILMQRGLLKSNEITAVMKAAALAVRAKAPNHGLGDSYIEDAQHQMFGAMREADGSPTWPFNYYSQTQHHGLRVSEGAFAGALMRETMAVANMR